MWNKDGEIIVFYDLEDYILSFPAKVVYLGSQKEFVFEAIKRDWKAITRQ